MSNNMSGLGKQGSGARLSAKLYREWYAKVKRHDILEAALKRISAMETEVEGLRPDLYGHAKAIADKALKSNQPPTSPTK